MTEKLEGLRAWMPRLHVAGKLITMVAAVMTYATIVTAVLVWFDLPHPETGTRRSLIDTLVLGFLLVFRNKEAYDRWWEGRKLWGQLTNDMRNFAIKVRSLVELTDDERRAFGGQLILFARVLRIHLRGDSLAAVLPASPPHGPLAVAQGIYAQLATWRQSGRLGEPMNLWLIDQHARGLMDVCGACERIRNTPLPSSYRALMRWGIGFYLLLAPWLVALESGFYGLPSLAAIYFFVLAIELTAEDIEQPFGEGGDDLDLDAYCRTVTTSIEAVLGSSNQAPTGK